MRRVIVVLGMVLGLMTACGGGSDGGSGKGGSGGAAGNGRGGAGRGGSSAAGTGGTASAGTGGRAGNGGATAGTGGPDTAGTDGRARGGTGGAATAGTGGAATAGTGGAATAGTGGATAGTGGGTAGAAGAMLVRVDFAGQVVTVAGTPLGLDSTVRLAPVSGSFAYDLRVIDSTADTMRGRYLHGGSSLFTFTVANHTVAGSGLAFTDIENLDPDTFRFRDGPQIDNITRIMTLDGTASPMLKLTIAITGGNTLFTSDAQPNPFPTIDITTTPHTFSLQDGGGTLLMQLDTLTPR